MLVKVRIFATQPIKFSNGRSRLFGGVNMIRNTTGIVLGKVRACRAEWLGWARGCLLMCTWFQRATVPRHRPSSPSPYPTDAVSHHAHYAIYVHRFMVKSSFSFLSFKGLGKVRSIRTFLYNWTNMYYKIVKFCQ